jgi:hypothetical protein
MRSWKYYRDEEGAFERFGADVDDTEGALSKSSEDVVYLVVRVDVYGLRPRRRDIHDVRLGTSTSARELHAPGFSFCSESLEGCDGQSNCAENRDERKRPDERLAGASVQDHDDVLGGLRLELSEAVSFPNYAALACQCRPVSCRTRLVTGGRRCRGACYHVASRVFRTVQSVRSVRRRLLLDFVII